MIRCRRNRAVQTGHYKQEVQWLARTSSCPIGLFSNSFENWSGLPGGHALKLVLSNDLGSKGDRVKMTTLPIECQFVYKNTKHENNRPQGVDNDPLVCHYLCVLLFSRS